MRIKRVRGKTIPQWIVQDVDYVHLHYRSLTDCARAQWSHQKERLRVANSNIRYWRRLNKAHKKSRVKP